LTEVQGVFYQHRLEGNGECQRGSVEKGCVQVDVPQSGRRVLKGSESKKKGEGAWGKNAIKPFGTI